MTPDPAWLVTQILSAALLPPGSLILVLALGLAWVGRAPRAGKALLAFGILGLYALSTPLVAGGLVRLLQAEPLSVEPALSGAQAIVVLGAGRYEDAPEYGGDTASALGLERLRYAAWLAKRTRLPVLVTGGAPEGGSPEAHYMKAILEEEFGVPVRWVEDRSRNTRENAAHSARLLRAAGVHRILLVTHAWHMPRARRVFEEAGLEVIPAGTRFSRARPLRLTDWVPDATALRQSAYALHELVGLVWYRLSG